MEQPVASTSSAPLLLPLAPSKNGRTPGKAHKSAKVALRRSYISPSVKTPFEKRREADKQREAVKGLEQEMKDETQAEKDRYA
jgi:rRNA-processing protein CGR1